MAPATRRRGKTEATVNELRRSVALLQLFLVLDSLARRLDLCSLFVCEFGRRPRRRIGLVWGRLPFRVWASTGATKESPKLLGHRQARLPNSA